MHKLRKMGGKLTNKKNNFIIVYHYEITFIKVTNILIFKFRITSLKITDIFFYQPHKVNKIKH